MSEPVVPQRFLDLAAAVRAPKELSAGGLRARFGDPAEVRLAVGQVWRARWEETSLLVLVLATTDREVNAVPVTIDPPGEDAASLVVDGTRTAFGVESTVWAGLAGPVPLRVLDRVVDLWEPDLVAWAAETADGGRRPYQQELDRAPCPRRFSTLPKRCEPSSKTTSTPCGQRLACLKRKERKRSSRWEHC